MFYEWDRLGSDGAFAGGGLQRRHSHASYVWLMSHRMEGPSDLLEIGLYFSGLLVR